MPVVAGHEQLPVAAARTGDPNAWDTLFRRYQLPLYAFIFELIRDEQASLDVVQETFVSALRHIGSLREDGRFGSWLFGIAHPKCVQVWRRRDRTAAALEELVRSEPDSPEQDPHELLVRREQETEFRQLVAELPPPQRSVLLLRFLEDFSLDEIARITGTRLGTVKSRLHYARQTMRKLLEQHRP